MYDYYFTFRSITGAQQGERVLMGRELRARLLRSPKFLSMKGCGYALKIRPADGPSAAALFSRHHVPYKSIYRVFSDGTVEEVVL